MKHQTFILIVFISFGICKLAFVQPVRKFDSLNPIQQTLKYRSVAVII